MAYEQYSQNAYQSEPDMGWDDVISNDGNEFDVVPEGDYYFKVTNFTRARHPGSEKMPACLKAVLTLALTSAWEPTEENPAVQGETTVNLFLNRKNERKLCQFFTANGLRKHGEDMRMNWNAVTNATGTCNVSLREWTGNDGQKRTGNDVKRFYDPEKSPVKQPTATRSQRPAMTASYGQSSYSQRPTQETIPGAAASGSGNPWSAGKF